jgi:hypothetical protein
MKLPEIKDLVMWDNRIGVVVGFGTDYVLCYGIGKDPIYISFDKFEKDEVITDIKATSLYDFQEAIGENVYDPMMYVTSCRVLETAKVVDQRGDSVYFVTLHDYDSDEVVLRTIRRYRNLLFWSKP